MQHFVCTGDCCGESERSKLCEFEGCTKEGQPLTECDCTDGIHKGVVDAEEDLDVESMDDEDEL